MEKVKQGYREVVDFGEKIGLYVDKNTGAQISTTRGIIHYDKSSSAHIVPITPTKKKWTLFKKQRNLSRRGSILLSSYSALVGSVLPNLRRVYVDWDDTTIHLYFIFDGDFTEDDQEEMECVTTEVIADFPDNKVATHFLNIPCTESIPPIGKVCIFARKESSL